MLHAGKQPIWAERFRLWQCIPASRVAFRLTERAGMSGHGALPACRTCRSLVTAFGSASGVSLARCAPQLRHQHEFEDMLQAVALGEADR